MARGQKTGGRHKGTPNKATEKARAFAESLITRPKYVAWLRRAFDSGEADVKLQILMWHYARGAPANRIELEDKRSLEEIVAGTPGGDAR